MEEPREIAGNGKRFRDSTLAGGGRIATQVTVFVAGFLSCAVYSARLGPCVTWDLKNYQYYVPYALLNGRFDYDYAAAQIQTFLNPASFVPFYLMATHFEARVAGFIMGGIHGLAAGLIFCIALALFSAMKSLPRILLSLSCAFVGMYGPTFIGLLGGSGNDNLMSLFVLAAVCALVRGVRAYESVAPRKGHAMIVAGAILLGMAAGLKLVCVVFLLAGGVAVVVVGDGWRRRMAVAGWFSAAGIIGFLLTRGVWMEFLWSEYGSPLFPFYNSVFDSPHYYDVNFADVRRIPEAFTEALLLPFRFATDNEFTRVSHQFRDIRYPLVYVLLLAFPLVQAFRFVTGRRRREIPVASPDRAAGFLLIFFVVSYVVWQVKFSIVRYIVPLELLAPVVIAVLIRSILPWRYLRAVVVVAALAAVVSVMEPVREVRGEWATTYLQVEAPEFDDPENTMVIIANNEPWSYVIPFFQPQVRFVGIRNNFGRPQPGREHGATLEMLDMVRAHRGPIYILSSKSKVNAALKQLGLYGIERSSYNDIVVKSEHERLDLRLWPMAVR